MPSVNWTCISFAGLFGFLLPVIASAQGTDPVTEAQRLRDSGEFSTAADLLRARVVSNPEDSAAARLYAQTVYWLKDFVRARAAYEAAMVRHPEDESLRLQYAQMLAETGDHAHARDLLRPLALNAITEADAKTLLGMLAYWEGDFTGARHQFTAALDKNPNQQEARRQLQEIEASTRPWLRVSSHAWRDDQPLQRDSLGLEAGWFLTPLIRMTAHVDPIRYRINGGVQSFLLTEGAISNYTPVLRLESELSAGALRRPGGVGTDWTARAGLGFRLPGHFTIRGRAERAPYLSTVASIDTPVMTRTATASLHWSDSHGWAGETAYQWQQFPDRNGVHNAYGWMLAPLPFPKPVAIQVGYSISQSNALASRFVFDGTAETLGRYSPYYTPDHRVEHSAIASIDIHDSHGLGFRLNGSYGVSAHDTAAFAFFDAAGRPALGTYLRRFSPWSFRTSLRIPVTKDFTLEPAGEAGRSAFYSWTSAAFQVTYHFKPALARGTESR